jgi:thiol-disulfide isomerase/thioredoxin
VRFIILVLLANACYAQRLVPYVEALITRGDLNDAQALTARYRKQVGTTPEAVAAMSWLARGELNLHQYDKAMADAEEVQSLVKSSLASRKLDSDPYLPLALGASYEVEAQSMVASNRRSEALQLLQQAEQEWRGTSIVTRLKKNLLLLTLVGHPLPEIRGTASVWRGKPALFFFWAHWCSDCKAMSPVIAKLAAEFEPKDLVVVAPTRFYGYTAQQETVTPAEEKLVMDEVFQRFYAGIPQVVEPVDASNFDRFGVSTTPTIVVADRRGLVTLYHPGAMKEEALAEALQAVVAR